jgi:hypothetical protein
VAYTTLADFERGARQPQPHNLAKMRAALERAGIQFLDGKRPGVRMK